MCPIHRTRSLAFSSSPLLAPLTLLLSSFSCFVHSIALKSHIVICEPYLSHFRFSLRFFSRRILSSSRIVADAPITAAAQEDLLIHGDSVYDIIDKQDHGSIQAELSRTIPQQTSASGSHHHHHHHHAALPAGCMDGEQRMFLCRMNVSRNARRQMRFGDQKVREIKQTAAEGNTSNLSERTSF